MRAEFKYEPLQKVIVRAYGLNYHGRIYACLCLGSGIAYRVEYSEDGSIEEGTFYEDDIDAA